MSVINKLRGYLPSQPASPPATATPLAPSTAASAATPPTEAPEAEAAPSTLHARLEELLGALVDQHLPAQLFAALGVLPKIAPMLEKLGGVIGLGKLPAIPANLPSSPAALKDFIAQELRQRSAADLAQVLQLAQRTTAAWLIEYAASQGQLDQLDQLDSPADPAKEPVRRGRRNHDQPTAE